MSLEKFCLKWDEFHTNQISSYQELRENLEFADVTLISEDNQRIEAHKLILSSASKFFKNALNGNKHSNPMIYMRGVKAKELIALVDFIYHGEVNIYQDDLNEFLIISEELKLKGLAGGSKETISNYSQSEIKTKRRREKVIPPANDLKELVVEEKSILSETKIVSLTEGSYITEAKMSSSFKDENTELDGIINSMLEKIDGIWTCTKCGKTGRDKTYATKHVETSKEWSISAVIVEKHSGLEMVFNNIYLETIQITNCFQDSEFTSIPHWP